MKKIFLFFLALTVLLPNFAFGQSARDSVKSLKRLESRVETGISYRDYAPALGEAKFQVKVFLESQEAESNPELRSAVSKAIEHYDNAHNVWNYKFSGGGSSSAFYESEDQAMFRQVLNVYPDAPYTKGWRTNIMEYSVILPFIWKKASEEIKKASDLISKSELKEMSIKNENEMLRKENEALKKDLAAIRSDFETLKKENMEFKQENNNLKKELENLKSKAKKK